MSELKQQDAPPPDLQVASTGTFTDEEEEVTTTRSSKKKVTISTVYDAPDSKISVLGASAASIASAVTLDSNIISSRGPSHRRGQSGDSAGMIEKTEHINRTHVRNVFRSSTTVGTVNMDQIERIRMSK